MNHSLLQHRSEVQPPVICRTAGYLPMSSPKAWLREVKHLRESSGQAPRLFLVPHSSNDLRPAGVLLLTSNEVTFGKAVLPLVEALDGVFILADSVLRSVPAEHERAFYFPHRFHLILPHLGTVGFGKENELRPSQLLSLTESEFEWTLARSLPPSTPLLSGFQVPIPEEDELNLLDSDKQQVGDLRKKNKKLPGADSPLGKVGQAGKDLAKGAAGLGLLGVVPLAWGVGKLMGGKRTDDNPTSLDKLHDWAKKNWNNIADARQKELNRLLDMMDKNPLEGLRYAIPLSGFEGRRGEATPGWKLGRRNLSLGANSNGGYAVDGWDIDYNTQLTLERKYRQAARNETAAGNHDRAAYIYGELLGDWNAAAKSLTDAGRHREATAIYLNKLNNPSLAARALENSGLLDQAAEQYLKASNFEKAGDIYRKLEQENRARKCFSDAIAANKDPLTKSRLYFEKLQDSESAIQVLEEQWRSGKNTQRHLKEHFRILKKLEEEQRALELLSEFEKPVNGITPLNKAEVALAERKNWPSPDFKDKVEELILGFTSRSLSKDESSREAKQLLNLLPKIQPQDPLLARDSNRFKNTAQRPKTIRTGMREGVLEPSRIIDIPLAAAWNSLSAASKDCASLAGRHEGLLAVAIIENEKCQATQYRIPTYPNAPVCDHHIAYTNENQATTRVFHFPSSRKVHCQYADNRPPHSPLLLEALEGILTIGRDQGQGFLTLGYTKLSSLTLNRYDFEGNFRTSHTLDLVPPDVTEQKWLVGARGNHLAIAGNQFITWQIPSGEFQSTELQSQVTQLEISPPHSPLAALITTETEVLLSFPNKKANRPAETINLCSTQGTRPTACYTNDGHIVIITGRDGFLFHSSNYATPCASLRFPHHFAIPKAVTAHGTGGFLVLAGQQLALFE